MKKIHYMLGMLLLAGFVGNANAQVSNDNEDGVYKVDKRLSKDFVPGQVLVKFKDESPVNVRRAAGHFQSVDKQDVNAVLMEFGVSKMEQLLPDSKPKGAPRRAKAYSGETIVERDLSQLYLVEISEEKAPQTMQLVKKLNTLNEVEFAEPNYKVYLTDTGIAGIFSGNPYATQQWYLDSYGVKLLWNQRIVNPKRPVIAILDTGVDMTHPDLAPNLWTNQAEADGEPNYDNDNNGFAGDVHGWDFINNTPNVRDFNMHGTHVAGIAAAANNGIGIIGANPMALIMPISVMQSDGTGDVATIVKGIDYAVKMGADVLNLSLGTYANSRAMRQALERAYQKAVIVAAAGNDGRCINSPHHPRPCYGAAPMFPAAYSFVLGVQATTKTGAFAGFSNYDDDGNTFSCVTTLQDPDGFNYELKAPGTEILSTIPGGKYKVLQGTSMAAPLVAGSISALLMVKDYLKDDNTVHQEILWGDLLHTNNIAEAFAVTNRPAELDLMKILYRERKDISELDEDDYSSDGEIDAGETVNLYPVIRTTFGAASNIQMKLEMGDEFEDPNTVEILTPGWVAFGQPLSAYGKSVSLNPMQLKVASNVADNRHIKMKFTAKCDETNTQYVGTFTMVVVNMKKISGLISENTTLTADHVYLVNENIGIQEGATLTIEPGTTLKFANRRGISSYGKLIAKGTPQSPITFTTDDISHSWNGIITQGDTLSYCNISYAQNSNPSNTKYMDCVISHTGSDTWEGRGFQIISYNGERCNILENYNPETIFGDAVFKHMNIIHNNFIYNNSIPSWDALTLSNYFDSFSNDGYSLKAGNKPSEMTSIAPSYLGSSKQKNVRNTLYEIGNAPDTYGQIDLSNMPTRPYAEAHGIVWKVVVNGKDAQDEYEDLDPLGVSKHKFEVYFNRPMNKNVTPQISFGVREPYTQNAVAEDGSWNEEGTIYTAYKTITGKTKSDGENRIYVWGAEDNEFFEIPYEKTRFNIRINAAGSLATGFAANAGMGRVNLTWNNSENDFDDAMGFNIYRYQLDNDNNEVNNVCINKEIVDIETTEYTDYDVTPGVTYYYMYKVLSTDLKEYDVSNVVAVTPLTSELGDANGSGDVDVADVITTVNYAAGMEPKPFIFEAADINTDLTIDILDVVGIIQKILYPSAAPAHAMAEATAVYTIEDGVLYVESPVALGGVQVQLNLNEELRLKNEEFATAPDLEGFEHASAWLSDNDYLFLAFNMNGNTLSAGKHALLTIGDAEISALRLSDTSGRNVTVEAGSGTTSIDAMGSKVLLQGGVFNLKGQKLTGNAGDLQKLPKGVYIINGEKVVK